MKPAHWNLTYYYKDSGGIQEVNWPPEEVSKAWRIFEAYRNTIKAKSNKIEADEDGYILTDYGHAALNFIEEQEEPKYTGKPCGVVYAPYVERLF